MPGTSEIGGPEQTPFPPQGEVEMPFHEEGSPSRVSACRRLVAADGGCGVLPTPSLFASFSPSPGHHHLVWLQEAMATGVKIQS